MKRFFLVLTVAGLVSLPTAVVACELDGLSHGYGPLSAMFAGAHRYQSLNGTDEPEEEAPAAQVEAASPSTGSTAQPPAQRRSFVAWAKAKPKAQTNDPTAEWARGPDGVASSAAAAGHSSVQGAPAPKP